MRAVLSRVRLGFGVRGTEGGAEQKSLPQNGVCGIGLRPQPVHPIMESSVSVLEYHISFQHSRSQWLSGD